ncbi:hypothetical protein JCM8097_004339 [Rhodosporidiobolus ruineniae]
MPAIKTCLAAIALAALAFSPVSASTHSASSSPSCSLPPPPSHLGRVGSPVVTQPRRFRRVFLPLSAHLRASEQRTDVLTRPELAEEAGIARRNAAAAALSRRAVDSSSRAKGGINSGLDKLAVTLAAANIRCGTDAVCARRAAAPPANGASVCITGRCNYRCNDGFAPVDADSTACVASASACDGVDCQVPDNGFATCDATTGACNIGCNAGYTRYSTTEPPTAPFFCFATATDPLNCGAPENVCPQSYNGIGTPACKASTCRIQCPAGYFLRRAASTTNPYYCYNGESSLVQNGPGSTTTA